eukprot:symbB.v1.2.020722.t1/scaffold1758.1/size151657/3
MAYPFATHGVTYAAPGTGFAPLAPLSSAVRDYISGRPAKYVVVLWRPTCKYTFSWIRCQLSASQQPDDLTVHFHLSLRERCMHGRLALHIWGPAADKSSKSTKAKTEVKGHNWFGETFYVKINKDAVANKSEDVALGLMLKEGDKTFGKAEIKYTEITESQEIWIFNDCVLLKEPDPQSIPIGDLNLQNLGGE